MHKICNKTHGFVTITDVREGHSRKYITNINCTYIPLNTG